MNLTNLFIFIAFAISAKSYADVNFSNYFIQKSMRVDISFAGDKNTTSVYLQQIKQETYWAGSQTNLIDKFNYGYYKYLVYDANDNKLIFSKGFSSLYQEWQATEEAKKTKRTFYETIIFPYPKNKVRVEIQSRNRQNVFSKIFEIIIDPNDYFINRDKPEHYNYYKITDSGKPENKIDIAIIPEGYTKDEINKLRNDAERFARYLFNCSPFRENKNKFNIKAIEIFSPESGTDIPGDSVWKNTALNTSFYTFDSERYLTTTDIKKLRDVASVIPYDQIYIMVNTEKYGGGGVYNYYSVCSSDNNFSEYVFCHEFGHAFAGLGDEYYESEVSVVDYYDTKVEPWEPNLTSLVDFGSKWKNMVLKSTPVPTQSDKNHPELIGAFEGGGYMSKGIFRPCDDCSMKSIKVDAFCPVCKKAISDMIKYYTE